MGCVGFTRVYAMYIYNTVAYLYFISYLLCFLQYYGHIYVCCLIYAARNFNFRYTNVFWEMYHNVVCLFAGACLKIIIMFKSAASAV